jgi:hypothetical protein
MFVVGTAESVAQLNANPTTICERVKMVLSKYAAETDKGLIWLWIGSHADYDKLFS